METDQRHIPREPAEVSGEQRPRDGQDGAVDGEGD